MKQFFYKTVYLLFVITFISCSGSNISDLQVIVNPDSLLMHVQNNDIIPYQIQVISKSEVLQAFQISYRTKKTSSVLVLDSALSNNKFNIEYEFKVPVNTSEELLELNFKAKTLSDYCSVTHYLVLDSTGMPLPESSAHSMYSGVNTTHNAFSIVHRQIENYPSDSLFCDIYDFRSSQFPKENIGLEWHSATQKLFARFNDFNYAEASATSLSKCYENATKSSVISNLKADDIILIGTQATALAVVKIIAVFDEDGSLNDRYVFNVKYITK